MLTGVAFVFLGLLPARAAGQLVSAAAQCSPDFAWLFTSINQSPCDVAVELASVCVAGEFNITQLDPGNVYLGPTVASANSCRCSSVYYSLLGACAFCQRCNYIRWSAYIGNCSTTYVGSFPQPIPLGVKVPTWAYQNVSSADIFDINIANSTNKSEGPPSSAFGYTSSAISSPQGTSTGSHTGSSDSSIGTIAGVVGGLVGLALIGGLVAAYRIWSRRRSSKTAINHEPNLVPNLNHRPEVTRPTIPGFSAPGTPFAPPATLAPSLFYHATNVATTSPQPTYPTSVGGTSDIYESGPMVLPNATERYQNMQGSSSAMPMTTNRPYDPQTSFSTLPVTTDRYWGQTSSVAHSQPATDPYYDSPVSLSAVAMHQTGDSRYSDPRSVITRRQSSAMSSSQGAASAENRVRLLPPAYADVVDGTSRRPPVSEKQ